MSIQSSIDQAVRVGTILYQDSPAYEKSQTLKHLKQEENVLAKQGMSAIGDPAEEIKNKGVEQWAKEYEENRQFVEKQVQPEIERNLYQQFQVAPSAESFGRYKDIVQYHKASNQLFNAFRQPKTVHQRDQSVADRANKKVETDRQFILNQKTNLGGKVRDLPKDLQDQIIKEYQK